MRNKGKDGQNENIEGLFHHHHPNLSLLKLSILLHPFWFSLYLFFSPLFMFFWPIIMLYCMNNYLTHAFYTFLLLIPFSTWSYEKCSWKCWERKTLFVNIFYDLYLQFIMKDQMLVKNFFLISTFFYLVTSLASDYGSSQILLRCR